MPLPSHHWNVVLTGQDIPQVGRDGFPGEAIVMLLGWFLRLMTAQFPAEPCAQQTTWRSLWEVLPAAEAQEHETQGLGPGPC